MSYNYITYIQSKVDEIYKNIKMIQKRHNKFNIIDILQVMIHTTHKNYSYGQAVQKFGADIKNDDGFESIEYISSSTFSNWAVKIYNNTKINNDTYSYFIKNNQCKKTEFVKSHSHIFDMFTVLSGDGTLTKCAIKNLNGTNIASITISCLMDISNHLFYDYKVAYDNNETEVLLTQPITKKHLLLLDRGYGKNLEFLKNLNTKTNFVVRITKGLNIYKNFIRKNINSDIINYKGMKLKLVRYYVDKKTKKAVIGKYANDKDVLDEDNDNVYVLATNVLNLSNTDCMDLYKERWNVEVGFKRLKQCWKP